MTVQDALKAITAAEGVYDGSPESVLRVQKLIDALISAPWTFWETYFCVANEGNPMQRRAEELLRSGTVMDGTTIGDLRSIL